MASPSSVVSISMLILSIKVAYLVSVGGTSGHWLMVDRYFHSGMTAGAFGGVAGIAALYFLEGVPRVQKDILQVCDQAMALWDRNGLCSCDGLYRKCLSWATTGCTRYPHQTT